MNLYKIVFAHYSPKDSEWGIVTYLLAEDDEQVYEWLKSGSKVDELSLGCYWGDKEEDEKVYSIYDDKYNVVGTETFKERMIRLNGECNDDEADFNDLYYGKTHYGWELVKENIIQKDGHDYVEYLVTLGIAQKV